MKRCTGQGMGKGAKLPSPLPARDCPQISMCSLNPVLLGFYGSFMTGHNWLNHWAEVEMGGGQWDWDWKFKFALLVANAQPQLGEVSHLINIKQDTCVALHYRKFQGLPELCARSEDQIYISYNKSQFHRLLVNSPYVSHMPVIQIIDGSVKHNKTTVRDSCVGHYGHHPRQLTGLFIHSFIHSSIQPRFIKHLPHARN